MKLAFLMPNAAGGGVEKVVIRLANFFTDYMQIDVDVVMYNAVGPNLDAVNDKVNVIDLEAAGTLNIILKTRKYLVEHKPTVIFPRMHSPVVLTTLATLGISPRPTIIGSMHSMRRAEPGSGIAAIKNRLRDFVVKRLFGSTDHLIAVSRGVLEQYQQIYSLDKAKTSVIYNPISVDDIRIKGEEYPEHPWFGGDEKIILATGRLIPQKNFTGLLHSFHSVASKVEAKLIVLGEGPMRGELESLRSELGLDELVDFPGYVNNPYAFMKRAHLFVLSSRSEGLGNVIIEALASGLPVVSTDCESGPREILGDNEWGKLVPVGDNDALAEAILHELDSPVDAAAQISRAWDFDVKAIARQYIELLYELV